MNEIQVHVVKREDEVFLRYTGPKNYIEHEAVDLVGQFPQTFAEILDEGERQLTKNEIRKFHLLDRFIDPVVDDLFEQNVHASLSAANYLTNRDVELALATSIGKREVVRHSRDLVAGLSHSVPSIEAVSLDKLVKMRQKEGEAFAVYRDKLQEVLRQTNGLGPTEMREMINDQIGPEIHKMELAVRNARKLLTESLKIEILVGTGFVAVGLFTGFLSPQAAPIITALGGIAFTNSIVGKVAKLSNSPEAIRENAYYFLWKLSRAQKRI